MNLVQSKNLNAIEEDLTNLLKRCSSRDAILTHFSTYLLGAMLKFDLEDYEFFPEITDTEMNVRILIYFPNDIYKSHELLIKKNDAPLAAYNRAMGIV